VADPKIHSKKGVVERVLRLILQREVPPSDPTTRLIHVATKTCTRIDDDGEKEKESKERENLRGFFRIDRMHADD